MDAELRDRIASWFTRVHREVFLGDPASNPRLGVEVLGPVEVGSATVFVLVTPWTLNGLVFLPDERFPDSLEVDGRRLDVLVHELPGIGRYHQVNLLGDVSPLASPAQAREVAKRLLPGFAEAVQRAREGSTVDDPHRRDLFRRLRGG